jgi:gamma-glutamylcyclotransferase (GGCT)/AIG2-like uncharacterized protein YtfP
VCATGEIMDTAATFYLFAYGTLREGAAADSLLHGCEHVGAGVARGILYDIDGKYPALLPYGNAPVHGEIWRCPADLLLELDRYEGTAQGLFRRIAAEVEHGDAHLPCWLYTAGPALSRRLIPGNRIEDGRWRAA